MSNDQDIIGVVRELQALPGHFRDKVELFPAIAQALLDRDEKLRIAVEAMEELVNDDRIPYQDRRKILMALSRVRSLPSS